MRLGELVEQMRDAEADGTDDPGILGIACDSREVRPGFLFAAIPGNRDDGSQYVRDAIERGAAALLLAGPPAVPVSVPFVVARDVRKALGEAVDAFYDHPSRSLDLIGVTGTNGKTTTAYLVRHMLNHAGRRCGMLGTIEYDLGDKLETAPLTTPDAVRFTRGLAEMRDFGCVAAVVEVSSHALDQRRAWPHRFAAAVFTNLTRDHLDYHGDMESYLEAKRRLFSGLDDRAVSVVNYADPAAKKMIAGTASRVLGYTLRGGEDTAAPEGALTAEITASDLSGQTFEVVGYDLDGSYRTPLVGRHNVENCLGAMLAVSGLGLGKTAIAHALTDFPGVPGRLERIEADDGRMAFVDYAHTDDALRSVLSVLRPLVRGNLITVFGCGGDRDPGKRPMMARAAEEFSDHIVVTSDNPRTEGPEKIIGDIMAGFVRPECVSVDADRAGAIASAVGMANLGDAVLVAGKGHEDYQIVGTEKHHLDDRELVREAFLASRRGV